MYYDDYRDIDSAEQNDSTNISDDFDQFDEFEPFDQYAAAPHYCPYRAYFESYRTMPPPPFGGFPGQGGPQGGFPPHGGPQGGFPGQGGPQGGAPSSPPPGFTPSKAQAHKMGGPTGPQGVSTYAVDPGAIRFCRFKYTFIWLRNGNSFWAWITFVGRRSISGYRWNGRRWVYFGIDLNRIDYFVCY